MAGIAHQINNPVIFIYGNIDRTGEYVEDLINLLKLYQGKYPQSAPKIQYNIEAINIIFFQKYLKKVLNYMKIVAQRPVQFLRNLSCMKRK